MDDETKELLKKLLGSNGYLDEFIGSWHRYVDAQENIAEKLLYIQETLQEIADKK